MVTFSGGRGSGAGMGGARKGSAEVEFCVW